MTNEPTHRPQGMPAGITAHAQSISEGSTPAARAMLVGDLAQASEDDLLVRGRTLVLQADLPAALAVFAAGVDRFTDSGDLHVGLAGLHWQMGQAEQAETILRHWLQRHPNHAAAAAAPK